MKKDSANPTSYTIGEIQFDASSCELRRGRDVWRLQKQCGLVLTELLRRSPNVVSRNDLASMLWPREDFGAVEDRLNHVISRLRSSLEAAGLDSQSVETCPGLGYRLVRPAVGDRWKTGTIADSPLFRMSGSAPRTGLIAATGLVCLMIITGALALYAISGGDSSDPQFDAKPQLAVLAFANLTGRDEFDDFARALADGIAAEFARIGSLRVLENAENSDYAMRSSILPGVDDSTLRVAVRVTKRGDEAFAWADILKQGGDSSGEFQARAINEIVVAVHRQLIAPEEQRLAAAQTSLPNVMELLEYGSRLRSLRKNEAAIEVLRQVIAADPNLARAYSELARALINYGWYTPVESAMAMPDARLAAWRALELDPSLADPYLVLANVTAFYDWDWEGAIGHYESALERNPNHAPAYLDYAAYQIVTGNIGHARELMAMAEKVGRQSAATQGQIGVLYHFIREWDLAHRHYDQALAIEPENTFWRVNKACTYIFSGDYELARELIAQLRTDEPQEPFPRIVEAYYRAVTTMEQQAHEAFASIEPGTLDSMSRLMRASILIALDRHEEALDNLEDAVDSRLLALPYSAIHPTHDPLRTNPRYQAVLKQIGLTSVAHNLVVAADIDFGNERRRMPALQSGASRTP